MIEVLPVIVRQHGDNKGVERAGTFIILLVYADDIVFTIQEPVISLPNLIIVLRQYGAVSGYKVNETKVNKTVLGVLGLL